MFSSLNFSNLIPSSLGLTSTTPSQEKAQVTNVEDNDTDPEDNLSNLAGSTKDGKAAKKKEKQATEVGYIFCFFVLLIANLTDRSDVCICAPTAGQVKSSFKPPGPTSPSPSSRATFIHLGDAQTVG